MKKIIVFGIVLMFFITSCAQGGEREENFRTGSEGLVMRFLPNQPPSKIYDDQNLDVQIEVANRGAYTVNGIMDTVYLSGFDHSIVRLEQGIRGSDIEEIEGKSLYNPIGSVDYVSFTGNPKSPLSSAGIDKYPFTLLATMCYGYETIASENVCIDPNPYGPAQREKVCNAQPVSFGTQGAPIAVTNVDVIPSKKRTMFKITIQNVGVGDVYKDGPDYDQKCSPYDVTGLQFGEIDNVLIDSVSVSGLEIKGTCKGNFDDDKQHVRLTNGQTTITCELANPQTSTAFVTPLIVKLNYGYRQTMSTFVEIATSS